MPLLIQASPARPVFRGVGDGSHDVLCAACGKVVLLENVSADAVFDVQIQCASCGAITDMPACPAGRGLGGILRPIRRDHRFVGTFVLDMDEVVVGEEAVRRRRSETGQDKREPEHAQLDIPGIERVVHDARSTFAPILRVVAPASRRRRIAKHRLVRLIEAVEGNLDSLRGGGDTVDLRSIITLQRAIRAFRDWERDPSAGRIMEESKQPEAFDHNAVLLQVATVFESAGLGAELVPPGDGRTPDLTLRVSSNHRIEIDTKTPRALQLPAGDVFKLVPARDTIRVALRRSRGQFGTSAILVLAGEAWLDGIDAYATATESILNAPLAQNASAEARLHYERLLGVLLVSTGYEEVGEGTYGSRLFLRWIPSPRYSGPIDLALSRTFDGPFSIRIKPTPARTGERDHQGATPDDDVEDDVGRFEQEPAFDPARFRKIGDGEVEADGTIVNNAPRRGTERTRVIQFPESFRPPLAMDFDVACEVGFTVVTVLADGSLLADPSVGWISLHGIRFKIA